MSTAVLVILPREQPRPRLPAAPAHVVAHLVHAIADDERAEGMAHKKDVEKQTLLEIASINMIPPTSCNVLDASAAVAKEGPVGVS